MIACFNDKGPDIQIINLYYQFDGSTDNSWPVHNPCAFNFQEYQFKGVATPHGNIFVR